MNSKPLRATILCAALTFVSASAAFAQSLPNLSGTWLLNFDKSGERIVGNGADVPFPSQMVIAQSPTELTVERTSVRQDPFKAVFKLDGSKVNVAAPEGITETGEAKFDGATLVITSRLSASIAPSSGKGGCWPRPRKPSAAALMTAVPSESVLCTISGATLLGRM